MYDAPEILNQSTTPAKIVAQLDVIRERYRMGLMDPAAFNEVLKLFQFRDAANTVWTPGAQTNQWYRREGREWRAATPPDQLMLPRLPLEMMPETTAPPLPRTAAPDAGSRATVCPTCHAPNVGKKFCTNCGTRLA